MASASFFLRWPLAHARKASPGNATAPPTIKVRGRGRESKKKSAAHAKPSGTRQRCIHVPPLANRNQSVRRKMTSALQTVRDGVKHPFHFYVHADPFRA